MEAGAILAAGVRGVAVGAAVGATDVQVEGERRVLARPSGWFID